MEQNKKIKECKSIDNTVLQELVEHISLQYFKRPFQHRAIFNSRLRTTGGRYHLNDHHLDFNPKLYEMYGVNELIGCIKHELCHYHLHLEGKGYQHKDEEFKTLLKETGGSRFIKPLVEQKTANYHQYECKKCQQIYLRKRRINTEKFRCRCGGYLKYMAANK